MHAYDVVVYKGIIMIRDKRYVNIIEENSLQPGVLPLIYTRTGNLGEAGGTYGMAIDDKTGLLYSIHPSRKIHVFNLSGIREGAALATTSQLAYKNGPYCLDFHEGRMFVSSNGVEKFCEADSGTGEIMNNFTVIGDITLRNPEKFCIRRNTLFIVDRASSGQCVYAIPVSELK